MITPVKLQIAIEFTSGNKTYTLEELKNEIQSLGNSDQFNWNGLGLLSSSKIIPNVTITSERPIN